MELIQQVPKMCGMKVVVVNCDEDGNVDIEDLKNKAEKHSKDLAALMVTTLYSWSI